MNKSENTAELNKPDSRKDIVHGSICMKHQKGQN